MLTMARYRWDKMTEQDKIHAVAQEMGLVTHMWITKDDLVNMLRWLWDKFEIEQNHTPMVKVEDVERIVEDAFLHKNNMSGMRRKILDVLRELDNAEPDKGDAQNGS